MTKHLILALFVIAIQLTELRGVESNNNSSGIVAARLNATPGLEAKARRSSTKRNLGRIIKAPYKGTKASGKYVGRGVHRLFSKFRSHSGGAYKKRKTRKSSKHPY
jgi:hypothetical protein